MVISIVDVTTADPAVTTGVMYLCKMLAEAKMDTRRDFIPFARNGETRNFDALNTSYGHRGNIAIYSIASNSLPHQV